jgi:hypothetical protein
MHWADLLNALSTPCKVYVVKIWQRTSWKNTSLLNGSQTSGHQDTAAESLPGTGNIRIKLKYKNMTTRNDVTTNSDLTTDAMRLLNELPELANNWLMAFPSIHISFLLTRPRVMSR